MAFLASVVLIISAQPGFAEDFNLDPSAGGDRFPAQTEAPGGPPADSGANPSFDPAPPPPPSGGEPGFQSGTSNIDSLDQSLAMPPTDPPKKIKKDKPKKAKTHAKGKKKDKKKKAKPKKKDKKKKSKPGKDKKKKDKSKKKKMKLQYD